MRKMLMFVALSIIALDPIQQPDGWQVLAQICASVLAISYLLPFAWQMFWYLIDYRRRQEI